MFRFYQLGLHWHQVVVLNRKMFILFMGIVNIHRKSIIIPVFILIVSVESVINK